MTHRVPIVAWRVPPDEDEAAMPVAAAVPPACNQTWAVEMVIAGEAVWLFEDAICHTSETAEAEAAMLLALPDPVRAVG